MRTLFLVSFAAFTMILASCASSRVQDLTKATQEALELVKKEAQRAIQLTTQKMETYQVDPDIGKQVIQNLQVVESKVDEQLAKVDNLDKSNNREAILKFPEQNNYCNKSLFGMIADEFDDALYYRFHRHSCFIHFLSGYVIAAGGEEGSCLKLRESRNFVQVVE